MLHLDVRLTLLLITIATCLSTACAGVLHPAGEVPSGTETISVLSQMFTETIGPGAFWLFALGLFASCSRVPCQVSQRAHDISPTT